MQRVSMPFSGVSKEILQEKLSPLIKKYNLSAEYFDGKVIIIGPKEIMDSVVAAYQVTKMSHDFFKM